MVRKQAPKTEDMSAAPIEPGTIHNVCGTLAVGRNKLGWLFCTVCGLACHPAVEKIYYTITKGRKKL